LKKRKQKKINRKLKSPCLSRKVDVQLFFNPNIKDYGDEIDTYDSSGNHCRIRVNTKYSKLEQILTVYHEITHMLLSLYTGYFNLNSNPEKICILVEKHIKPILKKYLDLKELKRR